MVAGGSLHQPHVLTAPTTAYVGCSSVLTGLKQLGLAMLHGTVAAVGSTGPCGAAVRTANAAIQQAYGYALDATQWRAHTITLPTRRAMAAMHTHSMPCQMTGILYAIRTRLAAFIQSRFLPFPMSAGRCFECLLLLRLRQRATPTRKRQPATGWALGQRGGRGRGRCLAGAMQGAMTHVDACAPCLRLYLNA